MGGRRVWRHFDYILVIIVALLLAYGVAMIYSANRGTEDRADLWRLQATSGLAGLGVILLVGFLDYRWLDSVRWILYVVAVGLLVLVLAVGGSEIGDVRRFLFLGSFTVQPSFVAMVLLIITLAAIMGRYEPEPPGFVALIVTLVLTLIAAGLVFAERDLSTAIVFVVIWLAMAFASGARLRYFVLFAVIGLMALPTIWVSLEPYMQDRLLNFIHPSRDPGAKYNIDQALISIGSGGWLGRGFTIGSQSQLHFLRVRHTDFIFSVIAEELGFAGVLLLFLLVGMLLLRVARAALLARDSFGRLIAVGVAAMFFFQTAVNVGMNLGLLPVSGLPLPFISYGRSYLLTMLFAFGLVESVVMRHKRLEF